MMKMMRFPKSLRRLQRPLDLLRLMLLGNAALDCIALEEQSSKLIKKQL